MKAPSIADRMQNAAAAVENSSAAHQQVKHRITNDPAIPLQGICPKELKVGVPTKIHPGLFIVALLQ